MKKIIKYILFAVLIVESLFIVYYTSKTIEKINQLEKQIEIMEQANLDLTNENNYLLDESERLRMMNSEIWALFLADHQIEE